MDCYCANYYGSANCHNTVPKFGDRCPHCIDNHPTPFFSSFSTRPTPACLHSPPFSEDGGYFQVIPGATGGGRHFITDSSPKWATNSNEVMKPSVMCIEDINDPDAGPGRQSVRERSRGRRA